MINLSNYFDKIFCINLDSRKDRWDAVQKQFDTHDFSVERIPAIAGSKMNLQFPPEIKEGAVGCSLSQLFAFMLAKQYGTNSFLLFEDDVEFDPDFMHKFIRYYSEVPDDWDILYLGGQHFHGMNLNQVSEHIYKCEYTLSAHSVAFKFRVYDRFINSLIDITKPCDVHYAQSHKELNAYVMVPHLTWQRNDYSDIEKFNVDYTFLKDHRYPQWGKP